MRLLLIGSLIIYLTGCATLPPQPRNTNNICSIFSEYPSWRTSTLRVERRWQVPAPVQMAIIYQESSFNADARPPRTKLLGFIPWKRPTSAYGYCQAINHTWGVYQRATSRYDGERHDFNEAAEFIGWYASRAELKANVSPKDPYHLYLAYHEGITNYRRKSYLEKPWLMRVARRVKTRAIAYRIQLQHCGDPGFARLS